MFDKIENLWWWAILVILPLVMLADCSGIIHLSGQRGGGNVLIDQRGGTARSQ